MAPNKGKRIVRMDDDCKSQRHSVILLSQCSRSNFEMQSAHAMASCNRVTDNFAECQTYLSMSKDAQTGPALILQVSK